MTTVDQVFTLSVRPGGCWVALAEGDADVRASLAQHEVLTSRRLELRIVHGEILPGAAPWWCGMANLVPRDVSRQLLELGERGIIGEVANGIYEGWSLWTPSTVSCMNIELSSGVLRSSIDGSPLGAKRYVIDLNRLGPRLAFRLPIQGSAVFVLGGLLGRIKVLKELFKVALVGELVVHG